MHYLIKVIVEAKNEEDALLSAAEGAEKMTDPEYGGDFDWHNMEGRWGTSKAYHLNSDEGKKLLREGMENTRREFNEAIKTVRYMLENFSEDDIFNNKFPHVDELPEGIHYLSRWQFTRAAGDSNSCYVYAPHGNLWGGKIANDKELEVVLKGNKNLWVVPIDFHN